MRPQDVSSTRAGPSRRVCHFRTARRRPPGRRGSSARPTPAPAEPHVAGRARPVQPAPNDIRGVCQLAAGEPRWALAYASREMEELVTQIEQALAEVERELSDPAVSSDQQRMAQLGRRHKELSEQAALGAALACRQLRGSRMRAGMLESEGDPEMRSYLEAELADSEAALAAVEDELRLALVERDPNDGRDVIIELRPGAGGDEAALFTGDIYRMLTELRVAARLQDGAAQRHRQRPGRLPRGDLRGKGDGAYSVFKWESGVHRVQRVPETESQGRIHTSTMTVAVLPEAEDVEVQLDPKDIKIDVYALDRARRPVGQHDRLGRAHHAPADGHRRGLPGRALADPEPRARTQDPARAPVRARSSRSATRPRRPSAARRSAPASARRRSAPTTSRRAARHRSPHQAHLAQRSTPCSPATSRRSRRPCRTRTAAAASRPRASV